MTQGSIDIHAISERVQQESLVVDRIFQEMDRVIVGQRYMVERLLIGLFL
jgi:MoxR-like ATPase